MIGFVEVDIKHIKKAYNYLKTYDNNDIKKDEELSNKIDNLSNIISSNEGTNKKIFQKKENKEVKDILEELVYSSFISYSNYIILRTELASLIQDIIYLYENKYTDDSETE